MKKYVCTVCGHVYDEEAPFESLAEFVCPICGVEKDMFEEEDA